MRWRGRRLVSSLLALAAAVAGALRGEAAKDRGELAVVGLLQFGIALAMLAGYRKGGVWGAF